MKQRTGLAVFSAPSCWQAASAWHPGGQPANEGAKVAAVVNGVQITMAEVEAAARMAGPIPPNLPEPQRRIRHRFRDWA